MKSVGIITYHHYYNYGTMLQAYALQKYVTSLGYDAEIIDFVQDNSMTKLEMLRLRIARLPVYIVNFKKYFTIFMAKENIKKRSELFENFYSNYIVVGKIFYSTSQQLKENPPIYDGYVVGSDQTWNPNVANAPEAFYLTFVNDDGKKGSYAPSVGLSNLSNDQKEYFRKKLEGFRFLSCREMIGATLLSNAIGKSVECVIDPTLLLTKSQWMSLALETEVSEPYILTYFLGEVKEHRDFVKKLAKKTGYKVVSLPISYREIKNKKCNQQWVGPDKFLSLINNAAYVCTDSFHGTAFAINFQVPFFSFYKRKEAEDTSDNSRIKSILQIFDLEDRLIQNACLPKNLGVDFDNAQNILLERRKKATDYLETMLKEITE